MARLERRFNGERWQLFAAAYEAALEGGAILRDFDPHRAMFRFDHNPRLGISLASFTQEVQVEVRARDEFSSIVMVETRARAYFGLRQLYDWGEGRRIATRILDGLEARWAQPLRALADAQWLRDPEHPDAQRFWDGREWTPFVWYRDSPHVIEPTEDVAPPIYSPRTLLGARRYRRHQLRFVAPAVISVVLFVVLLVARYA